jgi:hypothetical protein
MPLALDPQPALETSRLCLDELPRQAMRRTIRGLLESPEPLGQADTAFDVAVIPRRCLGPHWPERRRRRRGELRGAAPGAPRARPRGPRRGAPQLVAAMAAWTALLTTSMRWLCQGSGTRLFVRYAKDTPDAGSPQQ